MVAQRAMRPIAGLTRAAREVARTRDPDIALPKPQANDEVAELAEHLRGHAPRAERRARGDRGDARRASASSWPTRRTSCAPRSRASSRTWSCSRPSWPASSATWPTRRCAPRAACAGSWATCCCWRAPTPAASVPRAPVDLAAVAKEAAREASALSSGHPRRRSTPGGPVIVSGVADDLHRLAGNLIENALVPHARRHARDGVGAPRGRQGGARGGRPRSRRAARHARSRVRALRPRRRRRGADRRQRPRASRSCGRSRPPTTDTSSSLDAEGGGARFVVTLPVDPVPRSDPQLACWWNET